MKSLTHSQTSKVLTTFNHAGGSLNLCKGQHQEYPKNPVFSIFVVVSCMLSTHHVSSRIVISIYSILNPMNKHKWKICSLWSKPGMGLSSQSVISNFSVLSWHIWAIVYVHFESCRRSSAAVTPAKYECDLKNQIRAMSHNIWGPDMISRGPNIINWGPNIIIWAPHIISQGPHISGSGHDKWGTQQSRGSHIII